MDAGKLNDTILRANLAGTNGSACSANKDGQICSSFVRLCVPEAQFVSSGQAVDALAVARREVDAWKAGNPLSRALSALRRVGRQG